MMDENASAPTFFVGDIPIYGDTILSPMVGFSDLPFRGMCRHLGSAMSYTEFINAIDVTSTAWWKPPGNYWSGNRISST
jgi:hypothetical protein